MTHEILKYGLFIAGFVNVLLVVLHLFFSKLLRWEKQLVKIDAENRAVYKILNILITVFFIYSAYLSFFEFDELISTSLGNNLLVFLVLFWSVRLFLQFSHLTWYKKEDFALIGVFVVLILGYSMPIIFWS